MKAAVPRAAKTVAFLTLLALPLSVDSALSFRPGVTCSGEVCYFAKADYDKLKEWIAAVFAMAQEQDDTIRVQQEAIGMLRGEIARFGAGCNGRRT